MNGRICYFEHCSIIPWCQLSCLGSKANSFMYTSYAMLSENSVLVVAVRFQINAWMVPLGQHSEAPWSMDFPDFMDNIFLT